MHIVILVLILIAICLLLNITPNNQTCMQKENFNETPNNKVTVSSIDGSISINNAIYGETYSVYEKNDTLNGSLDNKFMFQNNVCSKLCCSPQYPTPFNQTIDHMTAGNTDDFVPSNYTCNNGWQNTGCLCLTNDQSNFLKNRGGNIV
jgi:hypothetical protein